MKKNQVFRSFGNVDRDINKHVLVAVEYGENIHAVTDTLIKAVNDDATGLPQYQKGYTASAYAPEPVPSHRRMKRYAYIIMAVIAPEYGEKNDIIEYGVTEENAAK